MAKGIRRLLQTARENVAREITGMARRGGRYAGAMAAEGYNGGYRDALDDVSLALSGVTPQRNGWWTRIIRKDRNDADYS